jgi:hypothetical protein
MHIKRLIRIITGMPLMTPKPPDAHKPNELKHTRKYDFQVLFCRYESKADISTGIMIAIFIIDGNWAVKISCDEKAYITPNSADGSLLSLMCSERK